MFGEGREAVRRELFVSLTKPRPNFSPLGRCENRAQMAGEAKAKTNKAKRPPQRKRKPKTVGLEPSTCKIEITDELGPIAKRIETNGGCVLTTYRDPLGGNALILAVLPIDTIQPTPFQ